ncbi:unnamed protein product [Caretta caretta]
MNFAYAAETLSVIFDWDYVLWEVRLKTCDVFLVVHHLFAFGGLLGLIINIKSGHYLPLMGLLLEMSTPSICMYWLLRRTGYANTLLWKANQWGFVSPTTYSHDASHLDFEDNVDNHTLYKWVFA